MRIPKEIFRYVEYEMYHYITYKKQLLAEKRAESGKCNADNALGNVIRLNKAREIQNMTDTVNAVNNALRMLEERHRRLFELVYLKGNRDIYSVCMKMNISDRSYWNYKRELVNLVAAEMGKIPLVV